MPASHSSQQSNRPGVSGQQETAPRTHPRKQASSNASTDGAQTPHPLEAMLGRGFGQARFERHAAILSDSRLSHPANWRVKRQLVTQLQRDYGNRYVQRLVEHISRTKAESARHSGSILQRMFSEDADILEGVAKKQKEALVAYDNTELEAALLELFGKGFEKRPSGGRLVYLKKGKWADAQADAQSVLGMKLDANKMPGGGAQTSLEGAPRELYSEDVLGVKGVIARNFSKSPVNGTIELHVADIIIEFKYEP